MRRSASDESPGSTGSSQTGSSFPRNVNAHFESNFIAQLAPPPTGDDSGACAGEGGRSSHALSEDIARRIAMRRRPQEDFMAFVLVVPIVDDACLLCG
uniref:Uncharacterized protein n=1 Tax=Triticum urartu TaxID=4572 RepID=A0A8R7PKZ8_TRIUA